MSLPPKNSMTSVPPPNPDTAPLALRGFAWGGLALVMAVIIWGAYVRATGSGAGCGDHWPLCNGELLPRSPAAQTLVEFTHRLTSGLALMFALALPIWTFRATPPRHPARKASLWCLLFMLLEAAIGAGLVLFQLVADDPSLARAYAMGAHLVNTFLLLAALTLTASLLSGDPAPAFRDRGSTAALFLAASGGMLLLGVSGAIAALGDTLFPASSLATGVAQDFSSTAHIFLRLRILHPVIAVAVGVLAIAAAWHASSTRPSERQRRWAWTVTGLVALQLAMGLVNVLLLAPVWIQVAHLLVADLLWMALLRTGIIALAIPAYARAAQPAAHAA
jgi:cytochrome c oxidase assembly protein subunit 15